MSKKLLVALTVIVMGLFMASVALADQDVEALEILRHFLATPASSLGGNSAATILNPEGKGDVLIFPYYDVREINGKTQDFLFAIINKEWDNCEGLSLTTQCYDGVAAKLRFREWDKSEEVFDIDIWLSRGDVWVGVVTHNTAIALPYGARITSPDFVIVNSDAALLTLDTPLKNGYDFPQTAFIPPGSSNLYGYIELIGEERTYDHVWTTSPAYKVTRVTSLSAGCQPRYGYATCAAAPNGGVSDVPNELVGYAYIMRVADGASFAYNAKAIANFNVNSIFSAITLFDQPGSQKPQLTDAEDSLESVEFQISKEELWGAYDIETIISGQYSLIVTFPTKHFHFCQKPNYTASSATGTGGAPANCNAPYPTAPWTTSDTTVGIHNANTPEIYEVTIWDRNENRLTPPPCYVSPCQGNPVGFPYELNILGFYQGSVPVVPSSLTRNNLAISTGTFDSGWFEIEMPNAAGVFNLTNFFNFGTLYTGYEGLPGFGLQLQEFSNGAVGGWYGAILEAWYSWDPLGRSFPVAP
jgi:hypothetical protein